MVPVAGRPFLDHLVRYHAERGARDFVILTGYLGDQVETYFATHPVPGTRVRCCREQSPLGTAGALVEARDALAPQFVLLNGDTFLECDAPSLLRALTPGCDAAMAVYDRPKEEGGHNARIANGCVTHYSKSEPNEMTHVDVGAYAFRRDEVLRLVTRTPAGLETEVFPVLAREGRLAALHAGRDCLDIGTFSTLALAQRWLA